MFIFNFFAFYTTCKLQTAELAVGGGGDFCGVNVNVVNEAYNDFKVWQQVTLRSESINVTVLSVLINKKIWSTKMKKKLELILRNSNDDLFPNLILLSRFI